jgi:hypothetical protein
VVAAVVVTDLLAQILYPTPNINASGHAGIIRTYAPAPKRSLIASVSRTGPEFAPAWSDPQTLAPQTVTEMLWNRGRQVTYL